METKRIILITQGFCEGVVLIKNYDEKCASIIDAVAREKGRKCLTCRDVVAALVEAGYVAEEDNAIDIHDFDSDDEGEE